MAATVVSASSFTLALPPKHSLTGGGPSSLKAANPGNRNADIII